MTVHPQRLRRIKSFMIIGREEEEAAISLLPRFPRQASFFAQQAVEKLLRAVIEAEDKNPGLGHNIRELTSFLSANHPLRSMFLEHEDVSSAATRFRYPTGGGGIAEPDPIEDLTADIKNIARLRIAVTEFLVQNGFLPKA